MSDEPHWAVIYLATIARETAWSSHFILWELPMVQGLGILHVAGIHHGSVMVWVDGAERAGNGPAGEGDVFERFRVVREREL